MRKRTIIKWWIWGLVIQVAGVILATIIAIIMAAHIVDLTPGNKNFVPDGFFWTAIVLIILGGIVIFGGSIAQLVAQIGALLNTHRLANQRWFHGLLWSSIVAYVVLFVTLGLQLGLGYRGSPAAGLVWPGYLVASQITLVLMLCYMIAGPDGRANQPSESIASRAAADARTDGLVQA